MAARRPAARRLTDGPTAAPRTGKRAAVQPHASKPVVPPEFATTFRNLKKAHPDAHCELNHGNAFELLVATVLSAQSTDVAVNQVTPGLFARWGDAPSLARAEVTDVEQTINRLGMYRQKAKNLVGLAQGLMARHAGQVPESLEELVALPGVGRKTANVVLGVAFGKPEGVVVDTHVQRISQRLGWTHESTPEKIERDLMQLVPRKDWDLTSHLLIFHGRRICTARKPACASCPVQETCPSAFHAEQVGRKAPRARKGGPAGQRATAQSPGETQLPSAAPSRKGAAPGKLAAPSKGAAPSRQKASPTPTGREGGASRDRATPPRPAASPRSRSSRRARARS